MDLNNSVIKMKFSPSSENLPWRLGVRLSLQIFEKKKTFLGLFCQDYLKWFQIFCWKYANNMAIIWNGRMTFPLLRVSPFSPRIIANQCHLIDSFS